MRKQKTKMADKFINMLVSFGLDTPVKRGIFGLVAGSAFDVISKPSWAYTVDGVRRSTYYANQDENSLVTSTYLPAGSTGVILGLALALFI